LSRESSAPEHDVQYGPDYQMSLFVPSLVGADVTSGNRQEHFETLMSEMSKKVTRLFVWRLDFDVVLFPRLLHWCFGRRDPQRLSR